ncbi:hypothetical protein [Streptomyces sp. NBC_01013]|uniref:hypothetical protein n=1 Tax=Streptomyces sp. NBC_01013 TaxID=2903718 RepID=UPI0038679D76|nr:hypothetical protein OG538_07630 [Streptomyces sp. NBC_01013]
MATVRKRTYVILDGTALLIDRIAAHPQYYPGEKKCHGTNVQVITDPAARLLGASDALPCICWGLQTRCRAQHTT